VDLGMTITVTSRDNNYVKEFIKIKNSRRYRYKNCKLAVEGPNLVSEALKAGLEPEVVFFDKTYFYNGGRELSEALPGTVKQLILTEQLFSNISDTETPQAVAALFPFKISQTDKNISENKRPVLILDRLQDPGNLGTIIRTAVAAGVERVYFTSGTTDPYSPKTLRATAGLVFRLLPEPAGDPLALLTRLQRTGYQILIASAKQSLDYRKADYTKPTALVIGNEANGVSSEILAAADLEINIPLTKGVQSLNAAVATGILLFEIIRCRP
jgi:RNA methyltransferase, TrmH family